MNSASSSEQDAINVCMETQGLSVEPPDDPIPDDWAAANLQCASDAGVDLPYDDPEELAAATASAHEFVACMRDLGWDIGDPVKSSFADYMKPPPVSIVPDRDQEQRNDITTCEELTYGQASIFTEDGEDESEHD